MTIIAVMGASGRTGSAVARRLLDRGVHIRAMARSGERLQPLAARGAEAWAGDASDVAYLTAAFDGADGAYVLMPHDPGQLGFLELQRRQGEVVAAALRAGRVRHVVFLSSLGADRPSGTGVILSLHEQEQRLAAIDGLHTLLLRPGAFFETYLGMLPVIEATGVLADALAPDTKVPMIATDDIAEVAADSLFERNWEGRNVRELLGPCDLTGPDMARILGARLGRPELAYVQLPYPTMVETLVAAGCAPDFAVLMLEMTNGLNAGAIRPLQPRSPKSATPTRFEDFVAAHVSPSEPPLNQIAA